MKNKEIKIQLNDGSRQNVTVRFDYKDEHTFILSVDFALLENKLYEGVDFFECLKKLRLDGEKLGIKLLCNGARTDAYPSGMSRDMGGGLMVHIQAMGKKYRLRELVFIFDEAPAETIGTVAEQWQFRQEWLNEGQPGREGGIDNTNVETITWREENGYQPE